MQVQGTKLDLIDGQGKHNQKSLVFQVRVSSWETIEKHHKNSCRLFNANFNFCLFYLTLSLQLYKVGTIAIPILQMRRLRHREVT